MILHLAEDEKFIDHVIDIFESAAPNQNIYFIEINENQNKLNYIKSNHHNMVVDTTNSKAFNRIIYELDKYDAVILHNLYNPYKQKVVREAPEHVHFHWMCWGADLYCIPELRNKIIQDEPTKNKISLNKRIGDTIQRFAPNLWFRIYLKPKGLPRPEKRKKELSVQEINDIEYKALFQKIKSASTVIPEEIKLVRKYLNPNIKYIPFKYVTIEGLINGDNSIVDGNNILVGNSATTTNNHLPLIKILKRSISNSQNIYMPLSYGDHLNAKKIIKEYEEHFPKYYKPITSFLKLEDYNKILNSCGIVIMNHIRQQAVGNIVLALWKGAKVYLNKTSPVLKHFKNEGIKLFKLSNKIIVSNDFDHYSLAKINREILIKLYSKNKVIEETTQLVNYLTIDK